MHNEKPICGAQNRRGKPCQCKELFKKGKCRFHGGLSTGPRTLEGKAAVAKAQRKRWRTWRKARHIN